MAEGQNVKVEQLKRDTDVRRALDQATESDPPKKTIAATHKIRIGVYLAVLLALGAVYYLVRLGYMAFALDRFPPLQRFTTGLMAIVLVLLILKVSKVYLIQPLSDTAARYNLSRVANLLAGLSISSSAFRYCSLTGIPRSSRSACSRWYSALLCRRRSRALSGGYTSS